MGLELIRAATGMGFHRYVYEQIVNRREIDRRFDAAERVRLYRDDYETLVARTLQQIFREPAVYQRLEPLIPLIGAASFLRRIADELGRPLYARAPIRRVVMPDGDTNPEAQEAYHALCKEMDIDAKMDSAVRLLTACAAVFLFPRYVESLGSIHLDVLTPDMLTVIPHPEAQTKALAFADVKSWNGDRPGEYQAWDDRRYFEIGPGGGQRPVVAHDLGVLPLVEMHLRGRTNCYWLETGNKPLVSQSKQSLFCAAVVVKKIRSQSHIQLTWTGSPDGVTKDQVSDEESILMGQGGAWGVVNLESDTMKIIETMSANEASVAAGYGVSRERLNQKQTGPADDVALHERVAELAAVAVPAEVRLFELVKRVAREHPLYAGKIPDDARLLVDLGQLFNRVDRATQLKVRQEERSMSLRSGVDDVLEDNPEMGGDRELAMRWIDEKMAEEAVIIARRRALNIPADATADEPGQDPQHNGAMGPKVRSGAMTRDEAAAQAATGDDHEAHMRRIIDEVMA